MSKVIVNQRYLSAKKLLHLQFIYQLKLNSNQLQLLNYQTTYSILNYMFLYINKNLLFENNFNMKLLYCIKS